MHRGSQRGGARHLLVVARRATAALGVFRPSTHHLHVGRVCLVLARRGLRARRLPPRSLDVVASSMASSASLMSTIYEEQKDEDGFLYITYSGENTFG